jgi:hypothetical protein
MKISRITLTAAAFSLGAATMGALSGMSLAAIQLLPTRDFLYNFTKCRKYLYAFSGATGALSLVLSYKTINTIRTRNPKIGIRILHKK